MKKLLLAAILIIAGALPAAVSAFAQAVPLGPRFVLPYQTVIDPTGVPIPGALLYFYASGTNTPLNTYADSQLTTPNPNPVPANAAGMFPTIFLSGNYKIVLTDSLNNQVWTADPVLGELSGGGASAISVGSTTVASGVNGDVLYDNAGTLGVLSPTITINSTACSLGSTCTISASAGAITVGSTTIAGGISGNILYQNGTSPSGTLGELPTTGTAGSVVLSSAPTIANLTVTGGFTATGLVTNADLANPAVTVNGTTCTLGSSCSPTAPASVITVGTTTIASGVANGIVYNNAGIVGNLAVVNNAVLVTSGAGVPSESTTLPSGLAAANMALTTPSLGVATATSLAIGGASLGGGAFAVTGASTFNSPVTMAAALTYGGVTLNNAVTGSGNMVLATSPTFSGTVGGSVTFSGNNTYSGSALFTGALATLSGNGQATLGVTSSNGAILAGEGSVNDLALENKSGAIALNVPTGTTNVNVAGTLSFGLLSSTSLGASPTTYTGLAANNSPVVGSDYVSYYSSANNAINKITIAALTASGVAGVSSLNGQTGGVGISAGTGINVATSAGTITVSATTAPTIDAGGASGVTNGTDGNCLYITASAKVGNQGCLPVFNAAALGVTTAFANAATAGGGVVYFPQSGSPYSISSPITIGNKITVACDGTGTILKLTASSGDMLQVTGTPFTIHDCGLATSGANSSGSLLHLSGSIATASNLIFGEQCYTCITADGTIANFNNIVFSGNFAAPNASSVAFVVNNQVTTINNFTLGASTTGDFYNIGLEIIQGAVTMNGYEIITANYAVRMVPGTGVDAFLVAGQGFLDNCGAVCLSIAPQGGTIGYVDMVGAQIAVNNASGYPLQMSTAGGGSILRVNITNGELYNYVSSALNGADVAGSIGQLAFDHVDIGTNCAVGIGLDAATSAVIDWTGNIFHATTYAWFVSTTQTTPVVQANRATGGAQQWAAGQTLTYVLNNSP